MTGRLAAGTLVVTACAAATAAATAAWTRRRWTVVVVRGSSMAPTLRDGDRLLVRRGCHPPERGDVVVFRPRTRGAAEAGPALRVKRVAGVAGDPIPAWVAEGTAVDPGLRTVPAGHLVVAGDARVSQDSRQLGLVPLSALVGVVSGAPGRAGFGPARPRRGMSRPGHDFAAHPGRAGAMRYLRRHIDAVGGI